MFKVDQEMENGIYVDVLPDDSCNRPHCPHGPALLFSRKTKMGDRKYYACSACRDRKLCRFFHWANEKYSDERRERWELERRKFIGTKSHDEMYASLFSLKSLISKNELVYCHICSKFIACHDVSEHADHDVTLDVSLNQIMHPTELLKPLECDKREAQYLFSKASVKTIINIALNNKINSVVCVGAPRIHEYIKTTKLNMNSILLDLDKRYHMFYQPKDFCWFNSFNYHFFFGQSSEQSFAKFLSHDKGQGCLLILDPPFGGRLEPLAHTLKNIESLYKQLNPHAKSNMSVILIYPYFMEQHVVTCLPTFAMTDYKVTYDNHPLFSQGTIRRKCGSPIRIFSNIGLEKVVLPVEEGYKFCKLCARWVSLENKHCSFCNKCTSKNGSTYVHCKKCQKCVKSTWKHCKKCNCCGLQPHECVSFAISVYCYQCGEEGHKKDACENLKDNCDIPIVNISNNSYKRKRIISGTKCKRKKSVRSK